jgi:alkaline phosphatase D
MSRTGRMATMRGPIICSLKHGVRSALEYATSFDIAKAHAVSNPDLAPHLEFIDAGGHG